MVDPQNPFEQPELYSRQNLATGPLADASLRAWAGLQAIRGYRDQGDLTGMQMTIALMRARSISWPPRVRTYADHALSALRAAPATAEPRQ